MNYLETVFLGILQGITEFLPISSSGHLVIFETLLHIKQPGVVFELAVHIGTLLSVIVVFYKDILALVAEFFSFLKDLFTLRFKKAFSGRKPDRKLMFLLIVASIPTAVIGLLLEDYFERFYSSLLFVGIFLIITSILLYSTRSMKNGRKRMEQISYVDALVVGVAQGLAIAPGISRSGSTISTGLLKGFQQEAAARFSFLLSIPAIGGAALLKIGDFMEAIATTPNITSTLLIGMVVSFISGIFALKFLLNLLKKGKLSVFAYYCFVVGVLTIVASFIL